MKTNLSAWITAADCQDESLRAQFHFLAGSKPHTRDAGSFDHFCVYFAGFDPARKKVFLGHHKKADMYLFNGGHLDENESPTQAALREMQEEWGLTFSPKQLAPFTRLSLTPIANRAQPQCLRHFDLWHFVPLDEHQFTPNPELLATEFWETSWLSFSQARERCRDHNTLETLDYLERAIG